MNMIKIEQLDKSMNQLTLNLMEYQEDDPKYQQIAKQLNEDYEIFNIFLNLQGINNPYYYIKYSNLHDIERILRNAGYIKESKKSATR